MKKRATTAAESTEAALLDYLPLIGHLHFYVNVKNDERDDKKKHKDSDKRIENVCGIKIKKTKSRGTSITYDGKEILLTINGGVVTAKFTQRAIN